MLNLKPKLGKPPGNWFSLVLWTRGQAAYARLRFAEDPTDWTIYCTSAGVIAQMGY